MNRRETHQILMILQANYPDSFRGMSKEAAEVKINLWANMFEDEPFEVVAAAVKAYMAADAKSFMPTVGQIKERIATMCSRGEMTELEAWNIVANALRNSAYGAEEEFDKLPPQLQRTVGSPNQLREWALMDAEAVHTVVASNFQRSFKVWQARERDFAKLPQDIKSFIAQFAASKLGELDAGDTKLLKTL